MANKDHNNSREERRTEARVNFECNSANLDTVELKIYQPSNSVRKEKRRNGYHFLPKPFERSNGSLLNPRFDSDVLESFLKECYFPQARRLFRCIVYYVAIASACWALFFGLIQINYPTEHYRYFVGASVVLFILMFFLLMFTYTHMFKEHIKIVGVFLAIILVLAVQLPYIFKDPDISAVGTFCGVVEILILLYSFFPLSLYFAAGLGGSLSISYEVITALRFEEMREVDFIVCKLLLHLIIHLIGAFIYIMSNTRARSNFSKIGESIRVQKDLMIEREIKEKMIHSLMPPAVANSVMATHPSKDDEEDDYHEKKKRRKSKFVKGEIIFRKFQMDEMKNVSILYADIVGFTKMSSNKTAEHLVGLLNDLFGRFDKLCNVSGCEKISTLGDCYYCVSGCPNPRPDHAKCCVEMGLCMVIAIQAFDEDHNEEVNMRVGIHTGTVLCGIVGTVRFKFDVWSNDVTLANLMESTGEQGKVHISESTREFLVDEYDMVEGEEVPDMRGRKELIEHYDPTQSSFTIKHREEILNIKTYFITGRKPGNAGIPGLAELANERPQQVLKDKLTTGSSLDTDYDANRINTRDLENGLSTPSTVCPGDEGYDNHDKITDDLETRPDVTLLKQNRSESYTTNQDRQLISLMSKENVTSDAFFKPSLNKFCLTFEPELENIYRHKYKDSHLFQENMLSSPRYQTAVEATIALVALIILIVCCHVMFNFARTTGLIIVTVLSLIVEAVVLLDALSNIICLEAKKKNIPTIFNFTLTWYFRNALGVFIATIPALLVYISLSCDLAISDNWHDRFFCFSIVVGLLQYCNYTMLSSFAKTTSAIIVGSILIILLFLHPCTFPWTDDDDLLLNISDIYNNFTKSNFTKTLTIHRPIPDHLFSGENMLRFELILSTLLLLFLICIINYEFENSYRLNFNASVKAHRDKENTQLNKDQAEWLLHNIIPAHLAEIFKHNNSYSRNHLDVGVIFASIVNFNEFYDEMYAGGREYLRVLNELVGDYEDLLSEPRFKDVEKIKTISSSFMAAAGLNEETRAHNKHKYAHLFALMEFAMELQVVVARFNESIFNFSFILNIGYNFGPVTAGVIGTTKLLYDIWGDTVNIASRMYSTGEDNRIQVPQATVDVLGDMFEFSYRDIIAVKGKGDMKTYLLERKKPGARWD